MVLQEAVNIWADPKKRCAIYQTKYNANHEPIAHCAVGVIDAASESVGVVSIVDRLVLREKIITQDLGFRSSMDLMTYNDIPGAGYLTRHLIYRRMRRALAQYKVD
jgi:hypothetical protein